MASKDKSKSFLDLDDATSRPEEDKQLFQDPITGLFYFVDSENAKIRKEILALPDDTEVLALQDRPLTSLVGVRLPSGLRTLDLGWTKLTSLSGVILPNNLRNLELTYTPLNSLTGAYLPKELEELWLNGTQLTSLDGVTLPKTLTALILDRTNLTNLIGVTLPESLEYLSLEDTLLSNLEGVTLPKGLEYLSLRKTHLTSLPESIRNLKALRTLDLSCLKLTELPEWLPELGLPFTRKQFGNGIRLYNTTVEGVDMSIFDQSQEAILQWFEERKQQGETRLNEIKVVFLGNGDVGKTHTIARLLRNGEKPDETFTGDSTPGIAISDKTYRIDGQDIKVHFWDFGGQDILYSMHRMFLTERTIYVVMVDARNETKGNQAREWLDTVNSFAGEAPVLLVVNKTDQNPGVTVDETALTNEYPNLKEIIYMSAKDFGKQAFNKTFTDAMLELIRESKWPKEKWPKNWKRVKDALQNLKTPYIRSGDYEQICRECGVEKGGELLLNWCNDLGVCFCRQDFRLKDYVILRPEWITNAIYTILFNRRDTVRNGMITQQDIDALLRNDGKQPKQVRQVKADISYSYQDTTYVLDVVRKFHLSYQVDRDTEFFPMLCTEKSSTVVQEYANLEDTLEFHMEFGYLPNNVLHRLMVERWQELDLGNVWRTGARFRQRDVGLSAVVKIESNLLKLYVRSSDPRLHAPNTYLSVIEGSIDRICKDLKLEISRKWLIYKVGGKQHPFDYEELLQMLDDDIETAYAASLDRPYRRPRIVEILKQLAPAEVTEQERLLGQLVKICIDLQATKLYWGTHEDIRNTFLGTVLRYLPYTVLDQTRRGISGSGASDGELDLDIRKFKDIPWTICEALRVEGVEKKDWNSHLDKLMINYNPNGLRFLILLTYVDDVRDRFDEIWKGFKAHIRDYAPDGFRVVPNSFHHYTQGSWTGNHYIQTARCEYSCGDYQPTVYHIFVRMGR